MICRAANGEQLQDFENTSATEMAIRRQARTRPISQTPGNTGTTHAFHVP